MRLKKPIIFIIIALLVLISTPVFAAELKAADFKNSKAVCVIDAATGELIWGLKADVKIFPASTTKVLTALIVLEKAKLDDIVTVAKPLMRGSLINGNKSIMPGEELSVKDLLYGLMLVSGNDCAQALAEHVAGSVEKFADMMNARVRQLGLSDTNFVNPHGIHTEDHYSTAYDMTKITAEAMKNEMFATIVSTTKYTISPTNKRNYELVLINSNRLITTGGNPRTEDADSKFLYDYANGVKTGATPFAGSCLVSSASKDGRLLIAGVYGVASARASLKWGFSKTLLEFGFENSRLMDYTAELKSTDNNIVVDVADAAKDDLGGGKLILEPQIEKKVTRLLLPDEEGNYPDDEITARENLMVNITAPIEDGEILGEITYSLGGEVLYVAKLAASRPVELKAPEPTPPPRSTRNPVPTVVATNPVDVVSGNSNKVDFAAISGWLVVPIVVIAFIILRSVIANKRRGQARRARRARNRRL